MKRSSARANNRPQLVPLIATGHYGRGDEVAGLVAYLASEAAAYVTGANLRIDVGFGS